MNDPVRFKFSDGRVISRDWMGTERMRSIATSFLKQRWKSDQFTGHVDVTTVDSNFEMPLVRLRIELVSKLIEEAFLDQRIKLIKVQGPRLGKPEWLAKLEAEGVEAVITSHNPRTCGLNCWDKALKVFNSSYVVHL